MKKSKKYLSIFLSLIFMLQIISFPSAYGMASNGTYENNDNPKSYEAMLNAIVIFKLEIFKFLHLYQLIQIMKLAFGDKGIRNI